MNETIENRELESTQRTVRFFENLLKASLDGIVIVDTTQNIITANEAFCSLFKRSMRDVVETSLFYWLEQLGDNAVNHWARLERSVRTKGSCMDMEFQAHHSGSRIFSVNASLVESVYDEETSIISIWRDVTEQKHAEQALLVAKKGLEKRVKERTAILKKTNERLKEDIAKRKQVERDLVKAKEEAEEATKLKDKFVSLVSHDLKSPVANISCFLKLINRESFSVQKKKEMAETALKTTNNMTKLIDDLLNISRLRTGKIQPQFEFWDMGLIAKNALENFENQAKQKRITLINKVPERTRAYFDYALFIEALQNLVSNAIKFCDSGDTITILIPKKEFGTLAVVDTGTGIKPEKLENLFNYESQTSSRGTRGESGSGLGLPLSKDIMQAHGGDLTVESTWEKGTTFYFRLPYVKPLVILVGDEDREQPLVRKCLSDLDINITETKADASAMVFFEKENPNLIIVDFQRPETDGINFVRSIREISCIESVPIIMLASFPDTETKKKAIEAGVTDFLSKPVAEEDFLAKTRRFLG